MIKLNNILLTTDFSENAAAAVPYAAELARRFEGNVHLVHVFEYGIFYAAAAMDTGLNVDPSMWPESIFKAQEKELKELSEALAEREKVNVAPVMLRGVPVQEILKYLTAQKIDCVVIATHGRTGFSHLVYGSVAERIVRMSPCPVLTIRPANMKIETV